MYTEISQGKYKNNDPLFWDDLDKFFSLAGEKSAARQVVHYAIYEKGHNGGYALMFEVARDIVQFYFDIKEALA